MDLSSLYNTLSTPPGQLQQAENEMMERFKAAALSITHLYKSSVHTSKQAYSAGYSACLTDILQTLQASLSTSSPLLRRDGLGSVPAPFPAGGMGMDLGSQSQSQLHSHSHSQFNSHSPSHSHSRQEEEELREGNSSKVLARLMDWVEARQEAMKLEAEEDKEKEEAEARGNLHPTVPRSGRVELDPVQPGLSQGQGGQAQVPVQAQAQGGQAQAQGGKSRGAIRQRDVLVQAVANARARSGTREMNLDMTDEDRQEGLGSTPMLPPTPAPTPTPTPAPAPTPTPTLQRMRSSSPLVIASSPLTPTPGFNSRSYKYPGGNYRNAREDHRSKLLNLNKGFVPCLPKGGEMPVYPGSLGPQEGEDGGEGFGSGNNTPVPSLGKRGHESAFGLIGAGMGGNTGGSVFGPTPVFGQSGVVGGRRRGRGGGFARFATNGRGNGSEEEEERERKRVSRRGA